MKNPFESPPPKESDAEKQELALLREIANVPEEKLRDLEPLNKYLNEIFGPTDCVEVDIEKMLETARLLTKIGKITDAHSILFDALKVAYECNLDKAWRDTININISELPK